jgi:hypothetical protein
VRHAPCDCTFYAAFLSCCFPLQKERKMSTLRHSPTSLCRCTKHRHSPKRKQHNERFVIGGNFDPNSLSFVY